MAPGITPLTAITDSLLDRSQTLRASTALLRKISSDGALQKSTATKASLLADADDEAPTSSSPIWLVLTNKKHITDKKRLKPGKIVLPHPYLSITNPELRICLITADPQRKYKNLIAEPSFPLDLAKRIGRVIGLGKLRKKFKSFEEKRMLLGEYDIFLADDRVITSLPQALGKVFYKTGAKRPIPVVLEGKRQPLDEQGNKRRKLSEGGTKVIKAESQPADMAREIMRAMSSALVHLVPSTTTAVKVGLASMTPVQIQENIETVTQALVEKYVPQQWPNVRSIHIKGHETAALPIYLTEELWADEKDVLEEAPPAKESKREKRRRSALELGSASDKQVEFIEVPGPDGKMRRVENPNLKRKAGDVVAENVASVKVKESKKRKSEVVDGEGAGVDVQAIEKAEKAKRMEALKKQKKALKDVAINGTEKEIVPEPRAVKVAGQETKAAKKTRVKAADMI